MTPHERDQYASWIASHVDGTGYGDCKSVTAAMADAFDDLEQRFGFYHSMAWGHRQHFWCRHRESHEIVDPTARQHPDGVVFPVGCDVRYEDLTDLEEHELAQVVPIGKCMNCGRETFKSDRHTGQICSVECEEELQRELGI